MNVSLENEIDLPQDYSVIDILSKMRQVSVWRLLPLLFVVYIYHGPVHSNPAEEAISRRVIRSSVSSTMEKIEVVRPSGNKHTGTVIILHGSDGTGILIKSCIEALYKNSSFPHLKILYPTAPLRPFTVLNDKMSHVWYNMLKISPDSPEQLETTNSMAEELIKLIEKEVQDGIPYHRIVIGGFSMGGSMAMHLGYRFLPQIGGVFALASYLYNNSITYKELEEKKPSKLPPLFYAHGDKDETVHLDWGQATFAKLQSLGVEGVFHTIPNTLHKLRKQEIDLLFNWINKIVPNN